MVRELSWSQHYPHPPNLSSSCLTKLIAARSPLGLLSWISLLLLLPKPWMAEVGQVRGQLVRGARVGERESGRTGDKDGDKKQREESRSRAPQL